LGSFRKKAIWRITHILPIIHKLLNKHSSNLVKTTAERVKYMMDELKISNQAEFARLCNSSRSLVNQWLSGRTKNVDPRYAFKIEDNTPFSARWIMLGEGNPKK